LELRSAGFQTRTGQKPAAMYAAEPEMRLRSYPMSGRPKKVMIHVTWIGTSFLAHAAILSEQANVSRYGVAAAIAGRP
jgi:hypothetical protein